MSVHRLFCSALATAFAFVGFLLSVDAGAAGRLHRIGVLCPVTCSTPDIQVFRDALAALGFAEGADIAFEYRSADADLKRLPDLARDLVRQSVDVIFTTWGTAAGLAAKRATDTIPVVVGAAGDLVAAGIVASLNRPGGNVTGTSLLNLELEAKRLELLAQLLPDTRRLAVFGDPDNPYSVLALEKERAAAVQLGVQLKVINVHEASEVESGFDSLVGDGIGGLCIHSYIPVLAARERIVELAAKNHIVAVYPFRDFVEAGGLLSYGTSVDESAKRSAALVAKILNGVKPVDLPVEQPTRTELVVNLKTAKALGLTLPPALLTRADDVIE